MTDTSNASFSDVIQNRGFLNLWINQILLQLSYNSLNFALIIWVFRLTDSTTAVSALIFATYLPAVIFGLFTGILVDLTDRKRMIMIINFLLFLCFLAFIPLKMNYLAILVIAFLINSLAQFYLPSESSAIPLIVRKKQLFVANSLFSITLFASFLLGFGLAGPLIHLLGIDFVFGGGALLLFISFLLSFQFPSIKSSADKEGKRLLESLKKTDLKQVVLIGRNEVKETLQLITDKVSLTVALFILAAIQVIIGILAVLIPSFFEKAIQVNATDASYVLIIPLGVGMVLGGILVGRFGHFFPRRKIVTTAIILAGLLLLFVGLAPLVLPVIHHFPRPRPLPFFYQSHISSMLAIGSFFLGMAMVSVVVPSQTVVQEQTPEQDRGKVFAVLGFLMSALTLVPVLLVGFLADVFGPLPIFLAMGGTIALIGLLGFKPDFYFDENGLPFKVRQFLGLGHWKRKP